MSDDRLRTRLLRAIRQLNRRVLDRLDPDWQSAAAPDDAPVTPPAPPAAPRRVVDVRAEATPNPDALKLSASVRIVPSGTLSFANADAAAAHPLGRALFAVDGVRSAFAVNDFVTVTRRAGADWAALAPALEGRLREFLESEPA